MQNVISKVNHDYLNKVEHQKNFLQRNMHEIETYVIYFYYEQHLHQHAKHKQDVNNYFFLIINIIRKKK